MDQLKIIARAQSHTSRIAVASASNAYTYHAIMICCAAQKSVAAVLLDATGDLRETHIAYLIPPGLDHIAVQWGIYGDPVGLPFH